MLDVNFKGRCPECSHGMLVQTLVKVANKMGELIFISDNKFHYECNFCGLCIVTGEAMELIMFSSQAIKEEADGRGKKGPGIRIDTAI